ncbi:hypothetical protein DRQ26_03425 [bacterium]|nr:MAG: hypothetical protein DRQ26_03425 [bacterium]
MLGKYVDILFTFFLASFFLSGVSAQQQFAYILGEINKNDRAYSIIQTFDGGYAVLGQTQILGAGAFDIFLIKFDSTCSLEWAKTYGGTENDLGFDIIQTPDSGYVFTGYTKSFGCGNTEVYIAKVDSRGCLHTFITLGGVEREESWEVIKTRDNGFAISGCTHSYGAGIFDILFAKFDSSLSLEWARTIGGDSGEYSVDCIQSDDGGYGIVATGLSFSPTDSYDVVVVKLDSLGWVEWVKIIGGDNHEYGREIIQTSDRGYMISGLTYTYGHSGSVDAFFVRLDSTGSLLWAKSIGDIHFDESMSCFKTDDEGYVYVGCTGLWSAPDFCIVKLDSSCEIIEWARKVGGEEADRGEFLVQTLDSGYAAVGATMTYRFSMIDTISWNILFLKFSTDGNNEIATDFFPVVNDVSSLITINDYVDSIIQISDISSEIETMEVTSEVSEMEVCSLLFLAIHSSIVDEPGEMLPARFVLRQNYPNPFNSRTTISYKLPVKGYVLLQIYNILGEKVRTLVAKDQPPGEYSVLWDGNSGLGESVGAGVYFYQLKVNSEFSQIKKLLLLK